LAFTSGLTSILTNSVDSANDPGINSFPVISKRFWRIGFNHISDPTLKQVPYISNLFLGKSLSFTTPYNFGFKRDNLQYQTFVKTMLDGRLRTSQLYEGRYVWDLKFVAQDNAFKNSFQTFIQTVNGKEHPFYFVDTDGTTIRYMHLTDDYNPITVKRFGINNIDKLTMREQLAHV
jgi:hypothetical protein